MIMLFLFLVILLLLVVLVTKPLRRTSDVTRVAEAEDWDDVGRLPSLRSVRIRRV
jgi:hypothetical protein